ncbi:MAG: DUF1565 domain-containing protein, partial [Candidatus Delongbacteria bacterium]|nr:DUF1565 domain-containing protein [Candidatus Delongbacteria bacterium]
MKKIFVIVLFVILCISQVGATDYYVDATTGSNSTGDGTSGNPWKTITYALSQISGTGHTLYVATGTYDPTLGETFPILMKNGVSLVGAGIDISIIDANSTNRVMECISIVDVSTKVESFTITGGSATSGAGFYISAGSELKIANNKITNNDVDGGMGGGIYIVNSTPVISCNIIKNNDSGHYGDGSGIYVENSSPTVIGNIITNNIGTAYPSVIYVQGSTSYPKIVNNLIAKNSGDGIYCLSSSVPSIINNTISDNTDDGIYISSISSASPDSIFNNIISLNSGYGINEDGSSSDPGKVWYNLFYANSSGLYRDEGTTDYYTASTLNTGVAECENNIDGDPMFVDRGNDDYRLRLGSPAIDAGDPDPQFNDPDGSRNDIGAFVFDKPPAVPQNLSATSGDGTITLRWNPNTEPDLDQYNIYRDLSSPAITLFDSVISTSPPDTFYVDAGLIIGQDYYYRIKALDTARNESDFSDEVSITIPFDLYTDSLALVALYDSTDGANWTDNTNWLTGPVSTWYGITVSGDRVTEIDLNFNNLAGTIPTEIGNLTNLTSLSLHNNQLTGSIPPEIGNLTNLTGLWLYSNQLSGSIPIEIGNLINLTNLQLFINQLTGSIPAEIGNLTNLQNLNFEDNQLSGSIPTQIGNLLNLHVLVLYSNQLTGSIPIEIENLTNLTYLNLASNQL